MRFVDAMIWDFEYLLGHGKGVGYLFDDCESGWKV